MTSKKKFANGAGWLTGFRVKPKKTGKTGATAHPSTIVFTIETESKSELVEALAAFLGKAQPINFAIEPSQEEIEFGVGQ